MRPFAGLVPFVLMAQLAGCGGKKYDPWLVPQQDFVATVRTIALVSAELPEELDDPDPAQATFDSLVAVELMAAGFTVVPAVLSGEIWGRLVDSVGGYYDPVTGRRDTTKFHPVRRAWRSILRDVHGADAVLFASVIVVDATVADWNASKEVAQAK